MMKFVIRRIIGSIPTVLILTFLSFSIMQLVPGDPATLIAGQNATAAEVEAVRRELGLDKPYIARMASWYADMFSGDFGTSLIAKQPVVEAIADRIPVTLSLAIIALSFTVVVAIPFGVLAALYPMTWIDQLVLSAALIGVSIPNFWLSLMLIIVFGVWWEIVPTSGYVPLFDDPIGWLSCLVLPAISLALPQVGLLARITRATMLEVMRFDYIRTAKAKGLPHRKVIWKHAFRNTLVPILTVIGIAFSVLIGGSVVIETVFSLPGVGRLLASAILGRDYPLIQGGLIIVSVMLVLVNLLVDVAYALVDPRVRYEQR